MRTYSELLSLPTFEERFEYLRLDGTVGLETFGSARIFNQGFYYSKEWKQLRSSIILRDEACDLAIADRPIFKRAVIHHMNPIHLEDIRRSSDLLLNPEYLITVSYETHNAIHYGDEGLLVKSQVPERRKNDTCPWKKS